VSHLAEGIVLLFAILALGSALGHLSFRGITLGTAGVLFVALVFGHLGYKVPKEVMDLGLVLFVYAVGLQAGPRFFRTFKRQGFRFVAIGLIAVTAGAVATVVLAWLLKIPYGMATGMYTGAMTCTPALAAAIDVAGRIDAERAATVSVAYGLAYPFSMVGLVLLIQALPKLLKREVASEEQDWLAEQAADIPKIRVTQFRVTNPNCDGMALKKIQEMHISACVLTRLRRGDSVSVTQPETVIRSGDVLMAVGTEEELSKMRLLLGEETQVQMDLNRNIVTLDVEVTEAALAGQKIGSLGAWEQHGVSITRLRRQGVEITPTGSVRLEMGDSLHLVGERETVDEFARLVDVGHQKMEETNMVSFLVGLVVGVALGAIPIQLAGGLTVKLGSAGGAFLMSLVLGHFGRIGRLRLFVPQAAKNITRELGLMLFLAGAGTVAGSRFVEVFMAQGWQLFLAGAAVTITSVAAALIATHWVFRMNLLASMGAVCACMTNPPALGAASGQTKTDLPLLSYASVYPVALIFKILIAQILVQALSALG